jgi:hypothetical protein
MRQGRKNLLVGASVAALGAWWVKRRDERMTRERLVEIADARDLLHSILEREGRRAGGHAVGQDLASYFRRGFGMPPVRIEIAPWRRRYYPAAEGPGSYVPTLPSGYRSTYPQSYQPYQTQPYQAQPYQTQPYQPYQTQPYQPPQVTYRSWSSPAGAVRQGVQVLPPPQASKGGRGRPDFANRWRVEKAQHALNAIYGNLLEEDGLMGPQTVDVIQMFQKQQGLPTTGVVDDRTQAALDGVSREPAAQVDDWWGWAQHPSEAS